MYGNNYMGFNQYGQYNPNYIQGYQQFQQPQQQRPLQQPIQQTTQQPMQSQEVPFSEVRYGTLDEAKAFIVAPNRAVMFINRGVSEFYIKSANGMGEPTLETYKYTSAIGEQPKESDEQSKNVHYVKREELKDYITFDDLNRIEKQLDDMSRKVDKALKVKDIMGGKEDGKQ